MNKKKRNKNKLKQERGITLIALVVTIIILIILATISVNMIFSENGLIATAKEAKEHQLNAVEMDQGELNKLSGELTNIINSSGEEDIEEDTKGVEVTIGGEKVILTEENFGDYLGKVVTNYKTEGGTETVTVGTANYDGKKDFIVSTTYRLYYIDFNNKYKDGPGTVYLKADCTGNTYTLSNGKATNGEAIKNLNTELYKEGVTAPTSTNNNMKAVTWLLDKKEWNGLVTSGSSTGIGNKVNYVVGAPSLEMMIDSYNTHYKLTGDTPDTTAIPVAPDTTRRKLFYKYTTGATGYQVGPGNSTEYATTTSSNSVKTDAEIDSMYYPGSSKWYWLASPSSNGSSNVMLVNGDSGGCVYNYHYSYDRAFVPLVSLKSDVKLQLK